MEHNLRLSYKFMFDKEKKIEIYVMFVHSKQAFSHFACGKNTPPSRLAHEPNHPQARPTLSNTLICGHKKTGKARYAHLFFYECSLLIVQNRDLRDAPAAIGAGDLKLDHRDRIRRTTYDTEAAADTLFFIDNHIRATAPGLSPLVHRIALHHAGEALHTDAVIRADIDAARTKNTDRGIDHNIQLTLQAATSLNHRLLGRIASLSLTGIAIALLERERGDQLVGNGLVIIDHTTAIIGQFNLFRSLGRTIGSTKIAVNRSGSIAARSVGRCRSLRCGDRIALRAASGARAARWSRRLARNDSA